MLNWDVLGEDYLALDGLESFVPTDEQTVTSTTSLVAAREESIAEDFGSEFSVESSPHFHYFLSGKKIKRVVVHCTAVCARGGGGPSPNPRTNDFRTEEAHHFASVKFR